MTGHAFPRLGAWVKIPAPESVELLAVAGFDFVVIDTEHAAIDVRTASTMIGLARGCGLVPFVRVPGTTPRDIQVPLDAGAAGLFVPHVDDADRARDAVRATRFPPSGRRGASASGRAGRWGLERLGDYVRSGDEQVRLVVQAESVEALANVVEIGSVAGVAAVFIGPADLALSSGLGVGDPGLTALVAPTERRCAENGIVLGTAAAGDAAELLDRRGYGFVVLGADSTMLRERGETLVGAARAGGAADDR